ncbi:Ig-like domain-containing protein [Marinigracilibium pacificum]|uniref:Ig-like domain-containing protein n=1 Tax=Marinigracilibium pacificum TaxID=2729599 RepID=A0A848IUV1_9BACT|nr:Ig-like domain-containing protein [Marinigracilibium pacificum]NMM47001.1 Ig-like domain-containing protein [Marinigracilibium pacificum]
MKIKYFFVLIALTIFALSGPSCANQVPPTGGPKDTIPPELLAVIPMDQSINVKPSKIVLTFDEDIKANKIKEQLIISPRLNDYTYSVKRNELTITFNTELDTNTTYTFNFRESIGDITEDNSPKNLYIAFSTGNYIDSLSIGGNIKELYTGMPAKETTVGLYIPNDTADFRKVKPRYVIETTDSGNYKFNNIKNGTYLIRAIKDDNKNLLLESNSESFGFISDTINLNTSLINMDMSLIKINIQDIKLNNTRPDGSNFTVNYNKGINVTKVESLNNKEIPAYILSEDRKKIIFYPDTTLLDSIHTLITVSDSINNLSTDTFYIKYRESKRSKEKFEIKNNSNRKYILNKTLYSEIKSNKPINEINSDKLILLLDTVEVDKSNYQMNQSIINDYKTLVSTTIILNDTSFINKIIENDSLNKINPNKLVLKYEKGSLISVRSDSSEAIEISYTFPNRDKFATLSGKILNLNSGAFIQLMSNNKVAYEKYINTNNPEYRFDYVEPGNYTTRLIIDSNNNRSHDLGNIFKGEQPEPIINNIKEYNLREKWEYAGEDIDLNNL